MTYTGFGGRALGDFRICMATSTDLINWKRHGVLLDEPNKNAALFAKKINGRYCLLHRRQPDIWLAYSDDLKTWNNHTKIITIRPDNWDDVRIGIAGPPVLIDEGWLLFYHGVDSTNCYRLGVVLLDRDKPEKVLARQSAPIIEPELSWEINGFIPNVIFSCATVLHEDRIYCCYGGADTVIGMAYIDLKDIKFDKSLR